MNKLYVGSKKIKSAVIKTKVNADFVNAGASDILSGKKSIDKNYNTLTGTMTITESLQSLTSKATATAAEITSGKTGYKNGAKITGSANRTRNPSVVIDGIIRAYKVANNNVISAGDFVTFVEEVCGCGYETTTIASSEISIGTGTPSNYIMLQYSLNKVLFLFNDMNGDYNMNGTIITFTNGVITYSTVQSFDFRFDGNPAVVSMGNSKIVGVFNSYATFINISNSDEITITGYGQSENDISSGRVTNVVLLDSNELFVTGDKWDGYDYYITYSRVKLVNNSSFSIVKDIPTDRTLYTQYSQSTACRLSHNKILLAYSQVVGGSSIFLSLDISNPNYVYTGVIQTRYVQDTRNLKSIQIGDDVGLVVSYTGTNSNGGAFVDICKVSGNNLAINYAQFANSNIKSIRPCQLTSTLTVIGYYDANSNTMKIIPVKITSNSTTFTLGTVYTITSDARNFIDLVKIEDNKVIAIYGKYSSGSYKINAKVLQINNETTVTELLTVYDMNTPLKQTMVALATGNDTINGISDGYGIGKLYGGDTINIIEPRTT